MTIGHNKLGQTSPCYCLLTPWLLDRRASNAISISIYIYEKHLVKDKYKTCLSKDIDVDDEAWSNIPLLLSIDTLAGGQESQ